MGKLFLLMTLLPVLELYLLLELGGWLGPLPTVLLIVVTGLIGAALARREGFRALSRVRETVAKGQLPAAALLDGALVLVGGVLLVTPGVVTDALGLALLVPPSRALIARAVRSRIEGRVLGTAIHVGGVRREVHVDGATASAAAGRERGSDWDTGSDRPGRRAMPFPVEGESEAELVEPPPPARSGDEAPSRGPDAQADPPGDDDAGDSTPRGLPPRA